MRKSEGNGCMRVISNKQQLKSNSLSFAKSPIRVLHTSSGTTGKPTLWARGDQHAHIGEALHKKIIDQTFAIDPREKTLVVIGFNFNGWVASSYTFLAFRDLCEHEHYQFTLYPSGNDIGRILPYAQEFHQNFDNIIYVGAPSFIRQLFERLSTSLKHTSAKVFTLTSGESTSAQWRKILFDLLPASAGAFQHVNIYGSADAGLIAFETRESIRLSALCNEKPSFQKLLADKLACKRPFQIMQYDPRFLTLSTDAESKLFITAPQLCIPLQDYPTGDLGAVISWDEMNQLLADANPSLSLPLEQGCDKLPFLLFAGREALWLAYESKIRIGIKALTDSIDACQFVEPTIKDDFVSYVENIDVGQQLVCCLVSENALTPEQHAQLTMTILKSLSSSDSDIEALVGGHQFHFKLLRVSEPELLEKLEALKTASIKAITRLKTSKPHLLVDVTT